jgi:hypothetical protein
MLPKTQIIIDYAGFFNSEPPKDRLALIKSFSKKHILAEFAGLNYWLKPKLELTYDHSLKFQIDKLRYFTGIDVGLQQFYLSRYQNFIEDESHYQIIFNRACNLLAMEEILTCPDMKDDDSFVMNDREVWHRLLQFIFSINSEITKVRIPAEDQITLELINANTLTLNELNIETDLFLTPFRGLKLLSFLKEDKKYGTYLSDYFETKVKSDPEYFIFQIINAYISKKNINPDLEFLLFLKEDIGIFEYLSNSTSISTDHIKLLSIKKAPFFKRIEKDNQIRYMVLDFSFLLEKCYNFFINDFWFDFLKNEKGLNHYDEYRGELGLFFQSYVAYWFKEIFRFNPSCTMRLFGESKIATSHGEIELSDIYVRKNNKIIIGEVKFTALYDKEKYADDFLGFYKNNRGRFYSDFGIDQTVNSIKNLVEYLNKFDSKAELFEELILYPVVVVNEKALQTPLIAPLFNQRFQELIANEHFTSFNIKPLTILHVSDLERIEPYVDETKAELFFDLIESHLQNQDFFMPFYLTLNTHLKGRKYSKQILTELGNLSLKFNPEQIGGDNDFS